MGKLTQEQRNKFYSVIHEDMKYSASYSESYGEKTLEELRQLSNQLEKKGYHLVDCMMIGPRTLREHLTDWGYNLDSMDKTTVLGMGAYLYDYSKKFEPVHRHTYEKKYPPVITFLKPDEKGNVVPEEEGVYKYKKSGEFVEKKREVENLSFWDKILLWLGFTSNRNDFNKKLVEARAAAREKAEVLTAKWEPVRQNHDKYLQEHKEKNDQAKEISQKNAEKQKELYQALFPDKRKPEKFEIVSEGKKSNVNPVAVCMGMLMKENPQKAAEIMSGNTSELLKDPDNAALLKNMGEKYAKSLVPWDSFEENFGGKLPRNQDGTFDFKVDEPNNLDKSAFELWVKVKLSRNLGKDPLEAASAEEKDAIGRIAEGMREKKIYKAVENWDFEKAKEAGGPDFLEKIRIKDKPLEMADFDAEFSHLEANEELHMGD